MSVKEITIRRKYHLERIGLKYETLDIELTGTDARAIAIEIEEIFRSYCELILSKKIA